MSNLILLVVIIGPFLLGALCTAGWVWWIRRDNRRSPLTSKLLNLPGEGLRKRLSELTDSYWESAAGLMMIGPVFLSAWLMVRVSRVVKDWSQIKFGWGDAILGAIALVLFVAGVRRAIRTLSEMRKVRQGLMAEMAVAQGLGGLAQEGAAIFHDFPADGFNIDHVVVGRSAVFAVETKSRRKPAGKGRESAQVVYDGALLKFPSCVETKPLVQAKRQAEWLQRFLASGVGEHVKVLPVLALPGWFVQNVASRSEVIVNNCKNPAFMTGEKFGPAFSDAMRKRIAHVLSERYPPLDV